MFSLLLLSMALSAPATATPVSAVAVNPGQLDSSDLVQMQFGSPEPRTSRQTDGFQLVPMDEKTKPDIVPQE